MIKAKVSAGLMSEPLSLPPPQSVKGGIRLGGFVLLTHLPEQPSIRSAMQGHSSSAKGWAGRLKPAAHRGWDRRGTLKDPRNLDV